MTVRRLLSRIEMLVVQSRFCIFFFIIEGRVSELGYSKVESWWRFLLFQFF